MSNTGPEIHSFQDIGTKYQDQNDAITYGHTPFTTLDELKSIVIEATHAAQAEMDFHDDGSGATLTTILITPEGKIHRIVMGDSPLTTCTINETGTPKKTALLNTLHNSNPYETNRLSALACNACLKMLEGKDKNLFQGTHDIHDLIQEDETLVVTLATDGILDHIKEVSEDDIPHAGDAWIEVKQRTQNCLEKYEGPISTALRTKGNIAQNIVEHAGYLKPTRHDNTSALSVALSLDTLPTQSIILMVADGCQAHGKEVANSIKTIFDTHLTPISPTNTPTTQAFNAAQAAHEKLIGQQNWKDTRLGSKKEPAKYINDDPQIRKALKALQIPYAAKNSSTKGDIIIIRGDAMIQIARLQDDHETIPRHEEETEKRLNKYRAAQADENTTSPTAIGQNLE